jgi:ABC-type transport system substrate-binding protein
MALILWRRIHAEVSMISLLFRIFLVAAILPATVVAQAAPASQAAAPSAPAPAGVKKALTIGDYTKWRSIEGAEISPDGKWVAYALRFMNTLPAESKPVLHVVNLDTNQDIEVPNAHSPSFSSDSRWVVYQIDSVPARGGRTGGAGSTPP